MKIRWVERRVLNPVGPDTVVKVLQSQQTARSPWIDVPVVDEVDGTVQRDTTPRVMMRESQDS